MKRFELAVDTSAATAHADMARRIIATEASCNWLLGMVSPKMTSSQCQRRKSVRGICVEAEVEMHLKNIISRFVLGSSRDYELFFVE